MHGICSRGESMAKELQVNYEGKPCYKIILEHNFGGFMEALERENLNVDRKICIVTDSNVAKLYLKDVQKLCKNTFKEVFVFTFDAGEASKNMDTVQKLYEELIKQHFDRKDLLLALGGGVVGDLTGFTAATYLRGIDFIQMPTTLLSQVDSSIGGKTGVDFLQYKNMVGAFYMPRMVYINIHTLLSLPEVQFASGMGEVIKHGLIQDHDYYTWLMDKQAAILAKDEGTLTDMVYGSCVIKKNVVETDPKENGIRAYLNFGHTVGHAIEKMSDFSLYHGQCVAIGMHSAAYLSHKRGFLTEQEYQAMLGVIQGFGLPVHALGYNAKEVLYNTKSDKKMVGGKIKFVILQEIGKAAIDTNFTDDELLEAIRVVTNS